MSDTPYQAFAAGIDSACLVIGRPLDAIDNDRLHRAFLRFQPQSELFLDGSEKRGATGIRRRRTAGAGKRRPATRHCGLSRVRGPFELEVEIALEASPIQPGAAELIRKCG